MNAQIIEDILNQAKVDKNGRIMNKGRLNDMLHSEHLKAVKNCSIPAVSGSFPSREWLMDVIDEVVDTNQTLGSANIADGIIERWEKMTANIKIGAKENK